MFRFLKRNDPRTGHEGHGVPAALLRILELNKELARADEQGQLLEKVLDAAIELAGAERGFVIQRGVSDSWEVVAARNIDRENVRKALHKISQTIIGRVLETGQPYRSDDALGDQTLAPSVSVAELKLRSVLCVPLRGAVQAERTVSGCLYVDNRFALGKFSEESEEILEAFADQAALALEQAQLREQSRTARSAAEQANAELTQLLRDRQRVLDQLAGVQPTEATPLRFSYPELIGSSAAMRNMQSVLDRVTEGEFSVLLLGESGTGKELAARALHANGPRSRAPFVGVNCGAIAEGLLESELFGALRGAYTGSLKDRPGLFEAAEGGVLFLDEIGEMSLPLQAKLLRVLQEKKLRRVGGNEEVPIDVRVISATNRDLATEVAQGKFREDLFYRLNVVRIEVPPLRERKGDIPALVEHFLSNLLRPSAPAHERPEITPACMERLMAHDWPGNVRELQNEVTRMVALGGRRWGPELLAHLDSAPRPAASGGVRGLVGRKLEDVEAELIRATLEVAGGRRGEAARMLGIPRRTFYNRLKMLGIE